MLLRSAATAESVSGSRHHGDLGEDGPELIIVVLPFASQEHHGHGNDAAHHRGDAKGIERDGRPDPGPNSGQQFDVAGAHAANRISGQQQAQPTAVPARLTPSPVQPK